MALHAQATAEAWVAFNNGANEQAIAKADDCINRYRDAADRIQSLMATNQPALPKGLVSPDEKKAIAKFQILHDVALCFLIKGWAEEKLGHTNEARKAFSEASKLNCARATESKGEIFWSPAEKASQCLAKP